MNYNYNIHAVFTDNDTYTADWDTEQNVSVSTSDGVVKVQTMGHPDRVLLFPADKLFVVEIEEEEDDE